VHLHPHPGRFRLRRFFNGSWWGWDGGWYIVAAPDCWWGAALVNPPADLVEEAARQLAANGPPVVETWTDDNVYMFVYGAIYPCVGALSEVPARGPFG